MEQQEKTEQALSAKKVKEMKKADNCTDRDTHGKLCVFRQCWSDGKHH